MHPLNPFLRALFRSPVPGQAIPHHNHVLLVPTTDCLLNGRDETGRRYVELVQDEEFLGSHVLRIPVEIGGKDAPNVRDIRSKAKTFFTINGRTVIIKESMVYSNKGFKAMSSAQILNDILYYSAADSQTWLIYYISKPLIGVFEPIPIIPAFIQHSPAPTSGNEAAPSHISLPKKKDIKSFNELLIQFPMIAKQMQPGMERVFNEFGKELGKPLPPPPSRTPSTDSIDRIIPPSETTDGEVSTSTSASLSRTTTENGSIYSSKTNGSAKLPFNSASMFVDEEDLMRRALETAVTNAIDLFQLVDKQQLSLLGATTDLTGPAVERLIERYVAEQVHDGLLFPRLCSFHKIPDHELDRRIHQMDSIDVSQLGIAIEDGKRGKEDMLSRVNRGVTVFRKIGVAGSPQEMLEVLLATQKAVTETPVSSQSPLSSEKQLSTLTINADVLVSLLLIVVIRSQSRHLQARLSYMQRFIYIDDVESGEIGYALSTLEAVLTYLSKDSGGLRKASQQNKRFWDAVKQGRLSEIKAIMDSDNQLAFEESATDMIGSLSQDQMEIASSDAKLQPRPDGVLQRTLSSRSDTTLVSETNLSHVFPFQNEPISNPDAPSTKRGKRVSLNLRSLSISSAASFKSRATTIDSNISGIEGDTSVESLAQTQDATGNSVLMMAVESRQPQSLQLLLSLEEHFPPDIVLGDRGSEGTTLLSAAVQLGHTPLIDIILDFVAANADERALVGYLAKVDSRGRTAAHYLFNAPAAMTKIANKLPWRQKDKIGQTPLYALCRSYDHPDYSRMVNEALNAAKSAQGDAQPLRLDDHVDNRGNTLLHIVNDPANTLRILQYCDADPNAVNDKKFTPLMLASKYGRLDMVRVFFGDPRVDLSLKESRGLTAVELAKDDEVRNRIDDLTLFSSSAAPIIPDPTGRITTVVRSFFVEDGTTRFILKSGAPSSGSAAIVTTYTITTSRRTLQDFERLAKWLAMDHPASYIPSLTAASFRSPFQIHSRPSRAVLHDTHSFLDRFLKIMLTHPTFGTHEMLWEFFLVPEMQSEQLAERAKLKARLLAETISDEYDPIDGAEVETVVSHSREMIRKVNNSTRNVIRRGHNLLHAQNDLSDALFIAAAGLSSLSPPANIISNNHAHALTRCAALMTQQSPPLLSFIQSLTSFHTTILAIQNSLLRPTNLILRISSARRDLARNRQTLNTQSLPRKFNFPGLEDNRVRNMRDSEKKIMETEQEIDRLGKELRYTHEVVVGELAGWTEWRQKAGVASVRALVKETVVKERERLKGMERCLRELRESGELSIRKTVKLVDSR